MDLFAVGVLIALTEIVALTELDTEAETHCQPDCFVVEFQTA